MPTTTKGRPPLDRRPSTKSAKAKKQAMLDEARKSIRIDGVVYTVDPAGITGSKERLILNEIGKTVMEFMEEIDAHPGVYTLGVFMWIAKLSESPKDSPPDLELILDSIGYGSDVEIVKEAAPRPEAPGGPS